MDNIFGVIVNVKHIYIPDQVKMNEDEYKALKGFVDLESISVTRRQFKLQRDAKYKFEIRVPREADMIATSKEFNRFHSFKEYIKRTKDNRYRLVYDV